MTRASDSTGRVYPNPLEFKAKRRVNEQGEPIDTLWFFPWIGTTYTVLQTEVTICD